VYTFELGGRKSVNVGKVVFIDERTGSCSHTVSSEVNGLVKVGKDGSGEVAVVVK